MNHKSLSGVKIGDPTKGEVTALFSRFNVVDLDKDVTRPGAFTDGQKVTISAYGHSSWFSALPIGRGEIKEVEDAAVLNGRFFMNTAKGRETFEVVKEMGELQEWSYGYDILKSSRGEFEGEKVQFLEKLRVTEVSPVLAGAGIETQTLALKSLQVGPSIDEWIHATKGELDNADRLRELLEHLKSGRVLSSKNESTLRSAYEAIGEVLKQLDEKPEEPKSGTQEPTRAIAPLTKDHLTLLLELEELEAS